MAWLVGWFGMELAIVAKQPDRDVEALWGNEWHASRAVEVVVCFNYILFPD